MLDQTSSELMIRNSVSVVDSLSASQNSSNSTVICTSSSDKIHEGSSCPLFAQVVYLTSDGEEENSLRESFDDDLGGDDHREGKSNNNHVNTLTTQNPNAKHEYYPDAVDLAEMDYSPARRKTPIHN